jgi:hypothetical protein
MQTLEHLKKLSPLIIFALFSATLNIIFFNGLGSNDIIFSGDQFFQFTLHEATTNAFYLRKPNDLGVLNGWQFTTQFWDALFYIAAYYFELSRIVTEKTLFFLTLFFSFYFSFLGFKKISLRLVGAGNLSCVYLVTIWYCCNPYTVELWHGGVYNLGSSLTYSLAPLIFAFFSESIFFSTNFRRLITTALLMMIASFTFWLFAPLAFFLASFTLARLFFEIKKSRLVLKNAFYLLMLYIPTIAFILYGITYEYFNNVGDSNAEFTPSFGNMQGGIWYQLKMLFSWGIYTVWWPRSLYPFGDYFFSNTYLYAIVFFYLLTILGTVRFFTQGIWPKEASLIFQKLHSCVFIKKGSAQNRDSFAFIQLSSILIVFVLCTFLSKGAQPPFGWIFEYLYYHVPFFNVFRTPDIRFGFAMILALSITLLTISKVFQKKFFASTLLLLTIILAFPLISGIAVKGQNQLDKYYDRITHLSDPQIQLAAFLNNQSDHSGYILPIPSVEYGNFRVDRVEHLIGQDLLPKIISSPFVYISTSGGLSKSAFNNLNLAIKTENYQALENFPIRYILIRDDICQECKQINKSKLLNVSKLVFSNRNYELFELNNYRSIIDSPKVNFEKINPTKYRVHFDNISDLQTLNLSQNFSKDWKVYPASNSERVECFEYVANKFSSTRECKTKNSIFKLSDFQYLWKKTVFEESHTDIWGYANSWEISPQTVLSTFEKTDYRINSDGTLNFSLLIYFQPQIYYFLTGLLSLALIFLITIFLLILKACNAKNKAELIPAK